MRIRFQSEGGFGYFPGLSRPVTIDTAQLAPEKAAVIENLFRGADFFSRPEEVGAPAPGAADHRYYTITAKDDDRSHTIRVTEAVQDTAPVCVP